MEKIEYVQCGVIALGGGLNPDSYVEDEIIKGRACVRFEDRIEIYMQK